MAKEGPVEQADGLSDTTALDDGVVVPVLLAARVLVLASLALAGIPVGAFPTSGLASHCASGVDCSTDVNGVETHRQVLVGNPVDEHPTDTAS